MSRQRLRESAVKWKVELTDESFAQKLLKIVELKLVLNKAKFVELKVCEKISDFLHAYCFYPHQNEQPQFQFPILYKHGLL